MMAMARRIAALVLVFLGAVLVVHTLVYLIPGDPAIVIAGEYADARDIERIRQELRLDDPFLVRYAVYVKRLVQLDLGNSIYSGAPVADIILQRFPATLMLALVSMAIATLVGVAAGMGAAYYRDSIFDRAALWLSSLCVSTPIFVTCFILSLVFSYWLRLLPPSGKEGLDPSYLILPALALASRSIALILRVVRNELIGVLRQHYIRTARAFGFSELRVVAAFAFRNIITPVAVIVLLDFGAYLGGAVVTESVFAWPGVGRALVTALAKRDIPVMQGIILFGTVLFLAIGVVIDLLQRATMRGKS